MTFATKKHFAGMHMALTVEAPGFVGTEFLKAAEGGMMKAATTEEPSGGYHLRERHAGVREVEPLSLEFGMAGSKWALTLMEQIVKNQTYQKISGSIVHSDANHVGQYLYEFRNAMITEFSLPKLDVKSKELAFAKIKVQPETINFAIQESAKSPPPSALRQKGWFCGSFRMTIDKQEVGVSSIEPLSVKIGAKAYQAGGFLGPQYNATGKLEMPKLSFVMPMAFAQATLGWFRSAVCAEDGLEDGLSFEKDVMIEFLDPSRRKVLYTVDLKRCGPEACSVVKSDDATRAFKFDCYVTSMELTPSGEGLL